MTVDEGQRSLAPLLASGRLKGKVCGERVTAASSLFPGAALVPGGVTRE